MLVVGSDYTGTITGIQDFGAFVRIPVELDSNLQGVEDGLVHLRELSDYHVEPGDVDTVCDVGDEVRVKVLRDHIPGKLSLSIRQATSKSPMQPRTHEFDDTPRLKKWDELVEDETYWGTVIKVLPKKGAVVKIDGYYGHGEVPMSEISFHWSVVR